MYVHSLLCPIRRQGRHIDKYIEKKDSHPQTTCIYIQRVVVTELDQYVEGKIDRLKILKHFAFIFSSFYQKIR